MSDSSHANETGPTTARPDSHAPSQPRTDQDENEFAAFLEEEEQQTAAPPAPSDALPANPSAPGAISMPTAPPKQIIKFGPEIHHKHHDWKRKPVINGNGACRVKSFRGKYSDQGLEHLDDTINEWLDANPDVEVKFVTSTVDLFEGKTREPALVLNLWY